MAKDSFYILKVGLEFNKKDIQSLEQALAAQQKKVNKLMADPRIKQSTKEAASLQLKGIEEAVKKMKGDSRLTFKNEYERQLKSIGLEAQRVDTIIKQLNTDMSRTGMRTSTGTAVTSGTVVGTSTAATRGPGRPPQGLGEEVGKTARHAALAAPIYGAIYGGMAGVQQAIQNYIEFDKTMTRIQMVSGKSTESMKRFSEAASAAGKTLSVTAKQYADASLIFFQQGGAAMDNAQQLAEAAIKLSNATGQAMGDSANSLTAIMNSFGLLAESGEQTGDRIADVLLKLDQTTASSGAEISDSLTRFASVAATAGFTYEEAAAQAATISSTTRLSAETIGTALKTFYTNLEEAKGEGEGAALEFTNNLREIANKYRLNIHPFDEGGQLRTGKEILDQVAQAYANITDNAIRQELVTAVAGKHQVTQVTALLENWQAYQENLQSAQKSQGAANAAQATYAQSIQAHLNEMSNAWEHFIHSTIESGSFKMIIDFLTNMIKFLNVIVGGQSGLLRFGALMTGIIIQMNWGKISNFWIQFRKNLMGATGEATQLAQATTAATTPKAGLGKGAKIGGAAAIGGAVAGISGFASDISAGKGAGEAVLDNIGATVGGAGGAALGMALGGPMGAMLGGSIGSIAGDLINKGIMNGLQQTEKAVTAYADEQASRYEGNKQTIQDTVQEYEYLIKRQKELNDSGTKNEYVNNRILELKQKIKELLPDITNIENLTVDALKTQISLQEYFLQLSKKNELKQQLKDITDQINALRAAELPGWFTAIFGTTGSDFALMMASPSTEAKQAEENKDKNEKNLEELETLKKKNNLTTEEKNRIAELTITTNEYAAQQKALNDAQNTSIGIQVQQTTIFGQLTDAQKDYLTKYLQSMGKSADEIKDILDSSNEATASQRNELVNMMSFFVEADDSLAEHANETKTHIHEIADSFKTLSDSKQLSQLQSLFKEFGIPDSTISDLQSKGLSLVEIMQNSTQSLVNLGLAQSIATSDLPFDEKMSRLKALAAGAGIKIPDVTLPASAMGAPKAVQEAIQTGAMIDAFKSPITGMQGFDTTPKEVDMAEGGDVYAGTEFLIEQYDKQIELLKKEDQTLDTVVDLSEKSKAKAAQLSNIIAISNKEKAKALATLGLGASATPEQIAAKISEINTKIASGGMTEETANILQDAISDVTTAMEKASDATDEFNNTLQSIIDSFKEIEIIPGIEKLIETNEQSVDSFTKYQDVMLTGAEKTLAFSDLQSQISDALSSTSDQYSRTKLLEYEKELNELMASGADVSSARVQFLQKQVGVIKERISLEKQSNAENKLSLVRQAGGGFTYQFKKGPATAAMPTTQETDTKLGANAQDFFIASRNAVVNAAKNLSEDTKTLLGDKAVEIMDKIKKGVPIEDALKGITLTDTQRATVTNDLALFQSAVSDTKLAFEGISDLGTDIFPTDELAAFNTQMSQTTELSTKINTGFQSIADVFDPTKEGPVKTLITNLKIIADQIKPSSTGGTTGGATGGAGAGSGVGQSSTVNKTDTSGKYIEASGNVNYAGLLTYLQNQGLVDKDTYKLQTLLDKNKNAIGGSPAGTDFPQAKQKVYYATGGYTGDSPGPRTAVLHEKELVLNKTDTKNFLAAISQMRTMQQYAAASPGRGFGGGGGGQNVVINANFPNVSSADEIKKAFASMSNNALQFNSRLKSLGAGVK